MKILLTGGSGFIGKNIFPFLNDNFEVYAPTRKELNLRDYNEVLNYLQNNKVDVVIHSANPNPVKNSLDTQNTMFEDSLQIFMNFYNCRKYYGKMYYLGSGAEFDKRYDVASVKEDEIGTTIPQDTYGFAKYVMNELARTSDNIYNLRIFACYGPFDHPSKFITHAIHCCMENKPITIRQNCYFDYMHVSDLGRILCEMINKDLKYHDYNICSGKRIPLVEIAEIVRDKMKNEKPVEVLSDGLNKEYTANNHRMMEELKDSILLIDIKEGIEMQIAHEKEYKS
jgi:GDP-L-fucose synthase